MEKPRTQRQQPLVIHCSSPDPEQFTWYYRDADGRLRSGDQRMPLPAAPAGTVLLLPACQIIFQQTTSRHASSQTLSWQLEELALSEPERLHTLVLHQEGEQLHLAAIDREWLRTLLNHLRTLGAEVTRALPDILAVREGHRFRAGERWLLRHQRWQGMNLNEHQLSQLQLHDALLASAPTAGQQGEPATDSDEQFYQQACLQRFTLLQGEFAVRLSPRPARAFMLCCALCSTLMLLIPPLWSGWQNGIKARQAEQQSLALYQHYFPQEKPDRPADRLAERLTALTTEPASGGALQLLDESAATLATLPDNSLQTLRWDEQQQQLHLSFARPLPDVKRERSGLKIHVEENRMTIGRQL